MASRALPRITEADPDCSGLGILKLVCVVLHPAGQLPPSRDWSMPGCAGPRRADEPCLCILQQQVPWDAQQLIPHISDKLSVSPSAGHAAPSISVSTAKVARNPRLILSSVRSIFANRTTS